MAKQTMPDPVANLNTADSVSIVRLTDHFGKPENKNGTASNITLQGRDALAMMTKLHGKADLDADALGSDPFLMKHFFAHVVELRNQQSGELTESIRLVLIDPEGKTISFCSQGAVDSLDLIRSCLGDGPYDPPVKVRVVRQKTRGGATVLRLLAE